MVRRRTAEPSEMTVCEAEEKIVPEGRVEGGSPETRTAQQGVLDQQKESCPRRDRRQRGGGVSGRYVRMGQDHVREKFYSCTILSLLPLPLFL